jgi:hypothetical protein
LRIAWSIIPAIAAAERVVALTVVLRVPAGGSPPRVVGGRMRRLRARGAADQHMR